MDEELQYALPAQLETLLRSSSLVHSTPVDEISGLLQEKAKSGKPIRILYGETFDEFGEPLDSLKYYLTVAILSKMLKEHGHNVDATILVADAGVMRNYPDKRDSILKMAERRRLFAEKVKEAFGCEFNVVLMSSYADSKEFQDKAESLRQICKKDPALLEMVRQSSPSDRKDISEKIDYQYTYEELATIYGIDIKVGPPREHLYDDIVRALNKSQNETPLIPLYLTPSFPFATEPKFYETRPDVQKYGITPYKSNSKSMSNKRIVVGISTLPEVKHLVYATQQAFSLSDPEPVRDLAVLVDLAKCMRLQQKSPDFELSGSYRGSKMFRSMVLEEFEKWLYTPLKEIGLWNGLQQDDHYSKLEKNLSLVEIDSDVLSIIKPHPLISNGYFFAHQDFGDLISNHERGEKFMIVSGRGPSGGIHLGHYALFKFLKELQEMYDVELRIPFSDDEKLFRGTDADTIRKYTERNLADLHAIGFNDAKTRFFSDLREMNAEFYAFAAEVAKRISLARVRATFGLSDEQNVGEAFYPAIQVAHVLYPSSKENMRALIVTGIDQHDCIGILHISIFRHQLISFLAVRQGFVVVVHFCGSNAIVQIPFISLRINQHRQFEPF